MAERTLESETSYYDLLEVSANASSEEIEASYHRITSYMGPDALAVYSMLDDGDAARVRRELDEAYRTLSDPERRAAYDRALASQASYPPVLVPESQSDASLTVGMMPGRASSSAAADDRAGIARVSPSSSAFVTDTARAGTDATHDARKSDDAAAATRSGAGSDEDETPLDRESATLERDHGTCPGASPSAGAASSSAGAMGAPSRAPRASSQSIDVEAIFDAGDVTMADEERGAHDVRGSRAPETQSGSRAVAEPPARDEAHSVNVASSEGASAGTPVSGQAATPPRSVLSARAQTLSGGTGGVTATTTGAPPAVAPTATASSAATAERDGAGPRLSAANAEATAAIVPHDRLIQAPPPRAVRDATRPSGRPRRLTPSATIEVTPDTEFSGSLLRRLRESCPADLDTVAEITKVSKRYLAAIEEHDFAVLPAPVYVRGFVTEYARVLGLDPQRVAQSYMSLYNRYRGGGGSCG